MGACVEKKFKVLLFICLKSNHSHQSTFPGQQELNLEVIVTPKSKNILSLTSKDDCQS